MKQETFKSLESNNFFFLPYMDIIDTLTLKIDDFRQWLGGGQNA